jgi:glycosyltransferase involved in cell wall biosynthesis
MQKNTNVKRISLIIPCFNESPNIPTLFEHLYQKLQVGYRWEVYFIDDGSQDNTFRSITEYTQKYQSARADIEIHGIRFSRNFGKEIAVLAGMDQVNGDGAVILDADLQHPLECISDMLRRWEEGYKMVVAVRNNRKNDPYILRVLKKKKKNKRKDQKQIGEKFQLLVHL